MSRYQQLSKILDTIESKYTLHLSFQDWNVSILDAFWSFHIPEGVAIVIVGVPTLDSAGEKCRADLLNTAKQMKEYR